MALKSIEKSHGNGAIMKLGDRSNNTVESIATGALALDVALGIGGIPKGRVAAERSLPTLGICRGLQLVNVHAGGTLHQHVPTHAFVNEPGSVEQHVVTLEPGSVLADVYGSTQSVNSLHHQSVDQLGANLRVTASTDDGGVEGIEHADLPIVAVQWHPEMLATAATDPIFRWLVAQAVQ